MGACLASMGQRQGPSPRAAIFSGAVPQREKFYPNLIHVIRWDVSHHRILPPESGQSFGDRSTNTTVIVQCGPAAAVGLTAQDCRDCQ
jgi:hypothetical protein